MKLLRILMVLVLLGMLAGGVGPVAADDLGDTPAGSDDECEAVKHGEDHGLPTGEGAQACDDGTGQR